MPKKQPQKLPCKIWFRASEEERSTLDSINRMHHFKTDTEGMRYLLQNAKDNAVSQPQSDVSTTQPSLQERAKTNPVLKELIENVNKPLPPPPCPFCSQGYIDQKTQIQYVFCDHVTKRHPRSGFIPFKACLKCWERKEYVKKKKGTQLQTESTETPQKPRHSFTESTIEKISNGTLEYECQLHRQKYQLKDLPCLIDHSFPCPVKDCNDGLLRILQLHEAC